MRNNAYSRLNIDGDTDGCYLSSGYDTESHVSLGDNCKLNDNIEEKMFSWNNIEYSINGKKILHGISGQIMKGQLVGILGHSGAGKTTLLNALSGRQKIGKLSGEIHHKGCKITNILKLKELCGYVTQSDMLYPTSTAKECIEFVADLRLPPYISDKIKQQSVDSVISSLKLSSCKDTKVGTDFKSGLSGGEAKRVSIGIELITNPQLLFLDEPISGLDSYHALKTMKILKNLTSKHEKQILLTVHQPNQEIFNMFDKLILMSK
eukprot:204512_1